MVGVTYAAVPLYRMFCQVRWAYLLRIWFASLLPSAGHNCMLTAQEHDRRCSRTCLTMGSDAISGDWVRRHCGRGQGAKPSFCQMFPRSFFLACPNSAFLGLQQRACCMEGSQAITASHSSQPSPFVSIATRGSLTVICHDADGGGEAGGAAECWVSSYRNMWVFKSLLAVVDGGGEAEGAAGEPQCGGGGSSGGA